MDSNLDEARRSAAQECAAIEADLERLKTLFADAAERLMSSFNQFTELEQGISRSKAERERIAAAIGSAVIALQFQDMASQLTGHAQRRLAALQECLHAIAHDQQGVTFAAPPQPVRQSAMSAGSVDLF
jgi:chromosome segregation ATPase